MGIRNFIRAFKGYRQYQSMGIERPPIAFYSEMDSDRIYFEPIIHRLIHDHHQKILYLTSAGIDPLLEAPPDGLIPIYIGEGAFRTLLFLKINVLLFVMTLPDLQNFYLKRSKHSIHYVYIFHSLVSTHMVYRQMAFNAYDSLFCVGPHHEQEIREAERLYNLPKKQLISHGYPRIDKIISDYHLWLAHFPKKTNDLVVILVAPSWGPTSISKLYAKQIVEKLLTAGYAVIYRPHPMTLRDEPVFKRKMLNQFASYVTFTFDDNIVNSESLFIADIMVSDWSGVALEFSLCTQKPVIFIDTPPKCNNPEFNRFESIPIEFILREELGIIVTPENIEKLPQIIKQLLPTFKEIRGRILKLRDRIIYNLGSADKVGARELMKLLDKQQEKTL